jgi:hypothetical protein
VHGHVTVAALAQAAMGYTRKQVATAYKAIGCIDDVRQVTVFLLDNPTTGDDEEREAEAAPAVRDPGRGCGVCLKSEAEMSGWVMLRPCGHVCVCRECAGGLSECPKCRRAVVECISAFLN